METPKGSTGKEPEAVRLCFSKDLHILIGSQVYAADYLVIGRVMYSVHIPAGRWAQSYELVFAQDPKSYMWRVPFTEVQCVQGDHLLLSYTSDIYMQEAGSVPRGTVRSTIEEAIHEMASIEKWRQELIALHGQLPVEMEELFAAYRVQVKNRRLGQLERDLAEMMGTEAVR